MESKFIPLAIVAVLLLILLGASYMFPFSKKSSDSHILETRSFSCPNMEGFVFKYPVFKGWEVKEVKQPAGENTFCYIILDSPSPANADSTGRHPYPQISVSKEIEHGLKNMKGDKQIPGFPGPTALKNSQDIMYQGDKNVDWDSVYFFTNDFGVDVALYGIGNDFPKDTFWKQVIGSFRIVRPITEEQAKRIALDAVGSIYRSPIIEAKLISGIWYVKIHEGAFVLDVPYFDIQINANTGEVIKLESGGGA